MSTLGLEVGGRNRLTNWKELFVNAILVPTSFVRNTLDVELTAPFEGVEKQKNMLRFDLSKVEWLQDFFAEFHLGVEPAGLVQGRLHLSHEAGLYRVWARFSFHPLLECGRCVDVFRIPVETEATCVFRLHQDETPRRGKPSAADDEGEIQLKSEDLDTYFYRGHQLNFDQFVLDVLQASVPDYSLCRSDCPGLCHVCGQKLNGNDECLH